MKWCIKQVDLADDAPGSIVSEHPNKLEGRRELDRLRAQRGPWKEDSIVHALMLRSAA